MSFIEKLQLTVINVGWGLIALLFFLDGSMWSLGIGLMLIVVNWLYLDAVFKEKREKEMASTYTTFMPNTIYGQLKNALNGGDDTIIQFHLPTETTSTPPIGYRCWRVCRDEEGFVLKSMVSAFKWEGPVAANDEAPQDHNPAGWAYRNESVCSAQSYGFYAYKEHKTSDEDANVWGEVDLFGSVVEHSKGWRAQKCRMRKLFVRNGRYVEGYVDAGWIASSNCTWDVYGRFAANEETLQLIADLEKRYQCDVELVPSLPSARQPEILQLHDIETAYNKDEALIHRPTKEELAKHGYRGAYQTLGSSAARGGSASTVDDYYTGAQVIITSGNKAGTIHTITDYSGPNKTLTLA